MMSSPGHEIVAFDVSAVDPAHVALVEQLAPGPFDLRTLQHIVTEVGPEDVDVAEQILEGLAVKMAAKPGCVAVVVTPIEAAHEAIWFGVGMRSSDLEERLRLLRPWDAAFDRIARRSSQEHAA